MRTSAVVFSLLGCTIFQVNGAESVVGESSKYIHKSYSLQAFTGAFNTPSAEVIDYGDFAFGYSDNYYDQGHIVNKQDGFQRATDLKFGVGLLPNLEIVGRLGTRTMDCNHYFDKGCGFRDLSGSIKWQLPYIPENWFKVAVGGQDVGGSVIKSQAYYVSASKDFDLGMLGGMRTSVGVGKSDNAVNYMDGIFGSLEYQPLEFVQLVVEYDVNAVNAGLKLFTPEDWLPKGWQVSGSAQLYSSDPAHNQKDQWFGVNLTVPMGTTQPRATTSKLIRSATSVELDNDTSYSGTINEVVENSATSKSAKEPVEIAAITSESVSKSVKHSESSLSIADVQAFADILDDYGFESISIGLDEQHRLVIEFENNLYNRNEDDAMQEMAKLIEQHLHTNAIVKLTNFGLVVNTVTLDFDDNKTITSTSYPSSKDGNLVSRWLMNDDVNWMVKNQSSAHFVPRLIVAPALASLVGTEYGSFDYQLLMSLNLQMSLWPGALVDFRYMTDSILESDDFENNSYIYNRFGIKEGVDRRLFHQAFSLPFNVFTQFSYGRIYGQSDGFLNESRWQSNNSLHRVSFLGGDFETPSATSPYGHIHNQPMLLKYRYRYTPLNWDLELTAGQYWGGDKGFTLRSLHWFDNVQVGLKYRRTKFDETDGGEQEDFFAIGFSIPLNFKKSMTPKYGFQVRGIEQWNYYVETSLTEKNTGNHIKSGFGQEPALYNNVNQVYFNRDRY
ncbi:YjbH domain-containing protein [Shewanella sp. Isolate11]|uniref:YjbH domain-containing protein n=1 Tax=Shewanella sp. Isolate11 TaxID=2908530 RepID=UPI001EFCD914|nr:YjbH domain-containing protein [Shewanella sp. Isolate11]MCG9697097.1 YjbH domain-containing protein [Shewanella sp. Isolate11]